MELLDSRAQVYAEKYTSPEDELLQEIHELTLKRPYNEYQMLSGHLQGQLLQMISKMIRPKRVLEIGTFTGYSALCLAAGLDDDGKVHTIEFRKEDANTAKGFFDRSFFKEKIILHVGDALDIAGELDETWDLVFIDADKENYLNYFNLIFPKVRAKGFILADNVLFHGQVLEKEVKGKKARAIQAFNDFVAARDDVERLLLPVRDGLMLMRKLH